MGNTSSSITAETESSVETPTPPQPTTPSGPSASPSQHVQRAPLEEPAKPAQTEQAVQPVPPAQPSEPQKRYYMYECLETGSSVVQRGLNGDKSHLQPFRYVQKNYHPYRRNYQVPRYVAPQLYVPPREQFHGNSVAVGPGYRYGEGPRHRGFTYHPSPQTVKIPHPEPVDYPPQDGYLYYEF